MNLFLSWFRPGGIFYTCRCAMCGNRLAAGEEVACADCYALLEYTGQAAHSLDNELAHRLWVKTEVNRCAALVLHSPHSRSGNMVYELKYCRHPEHGRWMGHMMGREMGREGFFDDIDFVIPANDDASKSIELILDTVCAAMQEGLEERKVEKVDNKDEEAADEATQKPKRARVGRKAAAAAPAAEEAPATEEAAE